MAAAQCRVERFLWWFGADEMERNDRLERVNPIRRFSFLSLATP
ncbi:hypothetical protein RESH_04208 [Rhodopirellula europaea SH398]|uniref:Uncharacterized protein n=2 Tax=Rhodopirellula europaea TaxID=1263866 RepID=M2AY59_9BACT|nr:hypothetical protein RE6C_01602 [Rhodopirellula europaea 6C]EMI25226.1 hypothetical protein RESH_04208 [Rhodopirellula europaea SH398]